MTLNLLYLSALPVVIYFVFRLLRRPQRPLPPGPKGLPIVGNLYDVPFTSQWVTYKEISDKLGSGIIHLNMMGIPVIVVNTREVAAELFDKKGQNYMDRPPFPMLNDLVGFDWHIAFMPYGNLWKDGRALFHREFNPPNRHYPSMTDVTRFLIARLLQTPDLFEQHLRHMNGLLTLSLAYGIDVKQTDDPYLRISESSLQAMAAAGNPGSFMVDSLPWLKYVPSWVPGAGFQTKAKVWRESVSTMPKVTLDFVKKAMMDGTAKSSIASRHLQKMEEEGNWTPYKEAVLSGTLGSVYAASADTTVSSLCTFILAMVQNPAIMKKAQAAVDNALGGDRLPEFSDRQSIPYVDAIMEETIRWRPVTPLSVAYRAIEDDEYHGYHIPAGAVVIGNAWALCQDKSVYGEDVDTFNPERFLKDGVMNPEVPSPDIVFGFGTRRVCPGQDMARALMWCVITSMLVCFDIVKDVDEHGVEINPEGTYSAGLLCYPEPFKCAFRPRSPQTEALIRAVVP
ncbi:cytochrome P450 [Mycena floridula]|nr:cytochrome P450 [Mycena floridula]